MVEYVKGLHEVAKDTWAWLVPDGSWGLSNAGLVGGKDGSLLVDTQWDLDLTRQMLGAMAVVTGGRPLREALNTHANGDHCYGNELLGSEVRIHAAAGVAEEMHELPPAMLAGIMKQDLGQPLTRYLERSFGCFNFEGITLRDPDVDVIGDTTIRVGDREIRFLPLGPAHTHGDTVAFVPDERVLFAGDLLFIGGTPIIWAGPVGNWTKACDAMLALEPEVVVPGHGPVTGSDGIRDVRDYLTYIDERARTSLARGHGWEQAAFEIDLDRFAQLGDSERIVVSMYTMYRALEPTTPALGVIELFRSMAKWAESRGLLP